MAESKPQSSYQIIGLVTASIFLMLFAFTMYKLDRAGATPYKTQIKNGYATMDDSYLDPPKTEHPLDAIIANRKSDAAAVTAKAPERTKERFEFYSVLPDFQVDVPTDNDRLRRAAAQSAREALESAKQVAERLAGQVIQVPANARPAAQIMDSVRGEFLQAGSFMDMSDARRRRAEVIMLGLNAKVESAQVQGRIYHRVKLGPYEDQRLRVQAQQRLATAGIDVIVKSR